MELYEPEEQKCYDTKEIYPLIDSNHGLLWIVENIWNYVSTQINKIYNNVVHNIL